MKATLALNGLSKDSRVYISNGKLISAFKVFTLHAGRVILPHFFHLKNHAARQFKQRLYSHFNIFIGFALLYVIKISNFTGGMSSDFM